MLGDVGGGDTAVINSVIEKLVAAAGGVDATSAQVAVVNPAGDQRWAGPLRSALADGRRVRLRHYAHGRDEATDRDVDPMRLLMADGRTYLEGWCRRAEGVRLFRLDRVLDVTVLDVPASVPESATPVDVDAGLFRPSATDVLIVLEVSAAARWVAEYYQC